MIKYAFKEGPLTFKNAKDADAQKLGEALDVLAVGGRLTPAAAVEAAQSKSHLLHLHFEWDNDVAARLYRLEQARSIISIIRVIEGEEEPQRAFISIGTKDGTAYHTLDAVQHSVDLQLAVKRQAHRDLLAWEKRYDELTSICDLVSVARERLGEQIEERPTA